MLQTTDVMTLVIERGEMQGEIDSLRERVAELEEVVRRFVKLAETADEGWDEVVNGMTPGLPSWFDRLRSAAKRAKEVLE